MCGITGIYTKHVTNQHKEMVASIVLNQLSRGPDHQAIEIMTGQQSQAIFGHNRLSIVDLSANSNQPMHDCSGRYTIVFNGEIYNYREIKSELMQLNVMFNTESDTEVILNAFSCWGINAINRFHGPFAFGVFDKHTDELWLCRDRFGVRPLYYTIKDNTIYFASTTSVLAKNLHLKPNYTYLARGLKYLIYDDHSDISPYEGLQALPSSHYLRAVFNAKSQLSTSLHQYYDLSMQAKILSSHLPIANTEHMLEIITNEFDRAVKIRLQTDVPLGISLSSGLDSSTVAAFVKSHRPRTVGFSYGSPAHKKSEGPLVAKSAKFMDLEIEYIWPTTQEMIDGLFKTIEIQEAPFSSMSIVAQYLLYKKVHASGIKVLLGGQGADESFLGYRKFILFHIQQLLKDKKYFLLVKNILQIFPIFLSEIFSLKTYWQHRYRYFKSKTNTSVLQLPELPSLSLNANEGLWIRQLQDITQYSLPTLLRYEDRNAMANSVESRLPFLDHKLVELGLAIPEAMKIRNGFGKWPIRQIAKDRIPNQIRLARFKRGFDVSQPTLIKAGLGDTIRYMLNQNQDLIQDILKVGVNIHHAFSDAALLNRPRAMAEAISLLWLNRVYS